MIPTVPTDTARKLSGQAADTVLPPGAVIPGSPPDAPPESMGQPARLVKGSAITTVSLVLAGILMLLVVLSIAVFLRPS